MKHGQWWFKIFLIWPTFDSILMGMTLSPPKFGWVALGAADVIDDVTGCWTVGVENIGVSFGVTKSPTPPKGAEHQKCVWTLSSLSSYGHWVRIASLLLLSSTPIPINTHIAQPHAPSQHCIWLCAIIISLQHFSTATDEFSCLYDVNSRLVPRIVALGWG